MEIVIGCVLVVMNKKASTSNRRVVFLPPNCYGTLLVRTSGRISPVQLGSKAGGGRGNKELAKRR